MIKRLELFSKKIPAELLKEKSTKPFATKFKKDFAEIVAKAQPMFKMAKRIEKIGEQKSKKLLPKFKSKFAVRWTSRITQLFILNKLKS